MRAGDGRIGTYASGRGPFSIAFEPNSAPSVIDYAQRLITQQRRSSLSPAQQVPAH
jgi:hypothetical protein